MARTQASNAARPEDGAGPAPESGYDDETGPREVSTSPIDRIAEDMQALAGVGGRFAGAEGERAMLHAVRERLPGGPASGRIEGFVSHTAPALVQGLHAFALLLAGLLGLFLPAPGAILCALVTLSLLGDGTGRMSLFRWLLPQAASYNLVARRPTAGFAAGSVVIVAPLDTPRWRAMRLPLVRGRRPMRVLFGAGIVVTAMLVLRSLAEPWGPRTLEIYGFAMLVLAAGVVLSVVAQRRSGDGRGDVTAPAAVLEVMRRFSTRPVPGVDLWLAFTGCSHAWQGGMNAFLALHARSLREPCLVIALDQPGRVPLRAVVSEGVLFPQHHRPTGPALVERLRWAGVTVAPIDLPGATDAQAALLRGYRALALAGGEGPPSAESTGRVVDVLETVVRWFADDLARVAVDRPALEGLARATRTEPAAEADEEVAR